MFASKTDIQTWLRPDKLLVDDANSQKPNIEARRIIVGQLSGYFSQITISSWADPEHTPEVIRSIAGRLAAAFLYQSYYAEEGDSVREYAQWLYNNSIQMLMDIKAGEIVVTDDGGVIVDVSGSDLLGFLPTEPEFTMDKEFA